MARRPSDDQPVVENAYKISDRVYCATLPGVKCVVQEVWLARSLKVAVLNYVGPLMIERAYRDFVLTMKERDRRFAKFATYVISPEGCPSETYMVIESDLIPWGLVEGLAFEVK